MKMKNPYHALKAVSTLLLASFLLVSPSAGSVDEYRPPETPEETLALARRTYDYVAKSVPEDRLAVLKKELDADAKWLAEAKDEKWRRVVEKDIRRIRRRMLFMHPDLQFDNLLAAWNTLCHRTLHGGSVSGPLVASRTGTCGAGELEEGSAQARPAGRTPA